MTKVLGRIYWHGTGSIECRGGVKLEPSNLSKKSLKISELAVNDIPEAVRDVRPPQVTKSPRGKNSLVFRLLALMMFGTSAIIWIYLQSESSSNQSLASVNDIPTQVSPAPLQSSTPKNSPTPTPVDNLLGHLPYPTAPLKELEAITPDGSIKLRKSAAVKYQEMVKAAANQGISLVTISGFRSLDDQQYLFFDVKAERRQNATKRAEVSAPPGYSEHHTGYAVDIGDGNAPETNLHQDFENTAAFQWLQANAAYYSFELSFTKNNPQGVSYEPWHWRYVGDRHSLETFYKARILQKK